MQEVITRYHIAVELLWHPGGAFHYLDDDFVPDLGDRYAAWYDLSCGLAEWEFRQLRHPTNPRGSFAQKPHDFYLFLKEYGDQIVVESGDYLKQAVQDIHTRDIALGIEQGFLLYFYYCGWYAHVLHAFEKIAAELPDIDIQRNYKDIHPLLAKLIELLEQEVEFLNHHDLLSLTDREILLQDLKNHAAARTNHWLERVREATSVGLAIINAR